jgi:hypothetical protein
VSANHRQPTNSVDASGVAADRWPANQGTAIAIVFAQPRNSERTGTPSSDFSSIHYRRGAFTSDVRGIGWPPNSAISSVPPAEPPQAWAGLRLDEPAAFSGRRPTPVMPIASVLGKAGTLMTIACSLAARDKNTFITVGTVRR